MIEEMLREKIRERIEDMIDSMTEDMPPFVAECMAEDEDVLMLCVEDILRMLQITAAMARLKPEEIEEMFKGAKTWEELCSED